MRQGKDEREHALLLSEFQPQTHPGQDRWSQCRDRRSSRLIALVQNILDGCEEFNVVADCV